ncbi:MAG: DsbA family oxidoreductase [Leptospirillia bacterium]
MDHKLFAEWYTDPLCSWSYAAESAMEAFRGHFGPRLAFTHRLLPLYRDLNQFLADHELKSEADFAPRILKVSRVTGVPMSPRVWELGRAPKSMEECCRFAKAALLTDPEKGHRFLARMRILAFVEGEPIGDPGLLQKEAERLGLDGKRLAERAQSPEVRAALQDDIEKGSVEGVTTRPTLILTNEGGDRVFIGGLRNPDLFILAGETLLAENA